MRQRANTFPISHTQDNQLCAVSLRCARERSFTGSFLQSLPLQIYVQNAGCGGLLCSCREKAFKLRLSKRNAFGTNRRLAFNTPVPVWNPPCRWQLSQSVSAARNANRGSVVEKLSFLSLSPSFDTRKAVGLSREIFILEKNW